MQPNKEHLCMLNISNLCILLSSSGVLNQLQYLGNDKVPMLQNAIDATDLTSMLQMVTSV